MASIEKMSQYYKVIFPSAKAAQQASDALMNFVTSNVAAMTTMVGPKRTSEIGKPVQLLSPPR